MAGNVSGRETRGEGNRGTYVTDVGRNTTNSHAEPWANSVQSATLAKYVRRSASTVSNLVTLTLVTKMALLAGVHTDTPTSTLLGSASTQ